METPNEDINIDEYEIVSEENSKYLDCLNICHIYFKNLFKKEGNHMFYQVDFKNEFSTNREMEFLYEIIYKYNINLENNPKLCDIYKSDEINKYLTKEFPFFVIDKNDNLYNKIYDAQQEKLFSDLDGEELNDYQKCVQELKNSPGESIALTVPEKQKLKQLNEEKKNNNDLIESEISNVNTFLIYNSKLSTVPNLWSDPKIKILYEKIIHIHILNDTDTEIDKKIKKFKDQDIIVLTEKQKKEKEKEALNEAKRKFNSIYHLISHSKNEDLRTKVNENMKNHIIDLKKAFESGDNKTKKQIFESIFESIFYLINAYRENDKTAKKRGKHQNKTVKLKK